MGLRAVFGAGRVYGVTRVAAFATFATACLGVASAGCQPTVADGARAVFSTSAICPYEGVTVRERTDVAPHDVLKGVSPPPGTTLDSVAATYEASGCNGAKKMVLVCGHPVVNTHVDPFSAAVSTDQDGTHVAINTGYFSVTDSMDIDGDRIASIVVCEPAPAGSSSAAPSTAPPPAPAPAKTQ